MDVREHIKQEAVEAKALHQKQTAQVRTAIQFEAALDEALKPVLEPAHPDVEVVRDLLDSFTNRVSRACNGSAEYTDGRIPGDPVACVVEPGHLLDRGQEYRIRVGVRTPAGLVPTTTLFRAFVPATGFPVELDLFEDGFATCKDASVLQQTLLEVASSPQVQATLKRFRQERLQLAK